jgi:hypothetical protein
MTKGVEDYLNDILTMPSITWHVLKIFKKKKSIILPMEPVQIIGG